MTEVVTRPTASPEELAGRIFEAAIGGAEVLTVFLGDRLGFYRVLAHDGPSTPSELAARTGTHERYVREWLEQQATAQLLEVDDASASPELRRYALPAGYEAVLVDELSPAYVAPAGRFLRVMGANAGRLLDVYRTGGGLGWAEMGADAREALAAFNRPFYAGQLATYLAQIPGLDDALKKPGATVAEVGCGTGYALIAIAQAYPNVHADGFDLDPATVEAARANVEAAGLSSRISIHERDAGALEINGSYDLVAAFECIHDFANPVGALAAMRRIARPGGVVLIMDENVAEEFGAFGNPIERLMYAASLFVCLPDGMSHQPSAATGTVMRPATLQRYALEAGASDVEILPLEHDMFRFYRIVE